MPAYNDFSKRFKSGDLRLSFVGGLQKFAGQEKNAEEFSYSSKYIHPTFHSQKNQEERNLLDMALIDTMLSLDNIQIIFNEFIDKYKLIEHYYETYLRQMEEVIKKFKNESQMIFVELTKKLQ